MQTGLAKAPGYGYSWARLMLYKTRFLFTI
jgi:hypothetical protein